MTYAYIADGAVLCEDCARTQLTAVWETVRKALIKARKYDKAQHANDGCYWTRKVDA